MEILIGHYCRVTVKLSDDRGRSMVDLCGSVECVDSHTEDQLMPESGCMEGAS